MQFDFTVSHVSLTLSTSLKLRTEVQRHSEPFMQKWHPFRDEMFALILTVVYNCRSNQHTNTRGFVVTEHMLYCSSVSLHLLIYVDRHSQVYCRYFVKEYVKSISIIIIIIIIIIILIVQCLKLRQLYSGLCIKILYFLLNIFTDSVNSYSVMDTVSLHVPN
jgi:hypothetical protein